MNWRNVQAIIIAHVIEVKFNSKLMIQHISLINEHDDGTLLYNKFTRMSEARGVNEFIKRVVSSSIN